MAAAGGRRAAARVSVYVSGPEREAIQAARQVDSARWGRGPLSLADWLAGVAEVVLRDAREDESLPPVVRSRAARAYDGLRGEKRERLAQGRPPSIY